MYFCRQIKKLKLKKTTIVEVVLRFFKRSRKNLCKNTILINKFLQQKLHFYDEHS